MRQTLRLTPRPRLRSQGNTHVLYVSSLAKVFEHLLKLTDPVVLLHSIIDKAEQNPAQVYDTHGDGAGSVHAVRLGIIFSVSSAEPALTSLP